MFDQVRQKYVVRPARLEDAEAVAALCNAWSMKMRGTNMYDAVEQRIDWQMPGFYLETDSCLVCHAGGTPFAYAAVWDTTEPHVHVGSTLRIHPEHYDPSVEEELLVWLESRARQAMDRAPFGARVSISQTVFDEDVRGKETLTRHGYNLVRHFVRLRIEMSEHPGFVEFPTGIVIRPFDPHADFRDTVIAVREAFRDHWGHTEHSLEEELEQWKHWIENDPDFDPAVWHIACDGEEVVGASLGTTKRPEAGNLAYIFTLGVRSAWRGRGIARALLHQSFAAFYERERPVVDLDADAMNLTGAIRLYQGVGMRVVWQNDAFEKEVRPGKDLARRTLD